MNITKRLKIMIFLQYFIWGCWLTTLSSYMIYELSFNGYQIGYIYSTQGISAIIMPIIFGIISDKIIPANKLYAFCHLISAIILIYTAKINNAIFMFFIMLLNSIFFIPTIGLANSIIFFFIEKKKINMISNFVYIRIYGTIGFIIASWIIGLLKLENSNVQLYIASIASFILSIYSIIYLPKISIYNLSNIIKLEFFSIIFKKKEIIIFLCFSVLIGGILQISNTFGNVFLKDFSIMNNNYNFIANYPSIIYSISQISEIIFIFLIPKFFKKFDIKTIMMISIISWIIRFLLFAFGDFSIKGTVLLILSMIIYGLAFDFFNISGSIFIEKLFNKEIRSFAQGIFMTALNGIGSVFGSIISGLVINIYTINNIRNWQSIWLVFSTYAFVLAIIFFFSFHCKIIKK